MKKIHHLVKNIIADLRGFSLVEIVIASGIFVIVGGLLMGILVSNAGLFYRQSSIVNQGVGSNEALSSIRASIKSAEAVMAQYPLTGTPQFTSGDSQIVLRLGSINSSGNIISNTYDFYVYYLNSGQFRFKTIPDALSTRKANDSVLALKVQNVLFEYYDATGQVVAPLVAKKVKITLTQSEKAGAKQQTNIATTEAQIRND